MFCQKKTRRSPLVVLMVAAVLASGFAVTAWAKKPPKPSDEDPVDTGTIYFMTGGSLWSMNPDGTGKTPLPVDGVASTTRHGADKWFLQVKQVNEMPAYFYPITAYPPDYWFQMSGLDDLAVVGFTGDPKPTDAWHLLYNVQIDSEGETDTFKWRIQSSVVEDANWVEGVPITGENQDLVNGSTCLTIKFDNATGHACDEHIGDAWCPVVRKTQRHEVFAVRGDGQVEVQLTDDSSVEPWKPGDPSLALPSWACDGIVDGKVSYLAQRWGQNDLNEDIVVERGLFVVGINWDDQGPYPTTNNPTMLQVVLPLELGAYERIAYDWSPDGTQIVYPADEAIWVADAYGTGNERLCDGWAPAWSPGSLIAFQISSSGEAQIRTIDANGGPQTTILALGQDLSIWSGALSWSPNGTHLIYTQIGKNHPVYDPFEIYRVGADGSNATNLTRELKEAAFSMNWRE